MNDSSSALFSRPQNGGAKYVIRFTENHMRMLRRNDPELEDAILVWVYGYFDAFVRNLSRKIGGILSLDECEDLVSDFFAFRFRPLVRRYANHSAEEFSRELVKSVENHAKDYYRHITTTVVGSDGKTSRVRRDVSTDEPASTKDGDARTLEDVIPELQTLPALLLGELCELDREQFREEVGAYIVKFCKGDRLREWILRRFCLEEMRIDEILAELPREFPGKNYAANSVYSLWFRFRHDAGLRRICKEYR